MSATINNKAMITGLETLAGFKLSNLFGISGMVGLFGISLLGFIDGIEDVPHELGFFLSLLFILLSFGIKGLEHRLKVRQQKVLEQEDRRKNEKHFAEMGMEREKHNEVMEIIRLMKDEKIPFDADFVSKFLDNKE